MTDRDVYGRVRVAVCTPCSRAHGIPNGTALFAADHPLPCEAGCGTRVRNVLRVFPETRDAFLASVASGRVGTWKRGSRLDREPAPVGKPFAANGGDVDVRTDRTKSQLFVHRCEDGLATTDPETGETRCGACEETDMSASFLAPICPVCAANPIPVFAPVEGRTSETNVCRVCGDRRLCQRFSVSERFLVERRKAFGFGEPTPAPAAPTGRPVCKTARCFAECRCENLLDAVDCPLWKYLRKHAAETDRVSATSEEQEPSPFIRVAFATDPRVIERAKHVYDSRLAAAKDEDEKAVLLRESVDRLLGSARERPDSPEGVWLREAEALAARLGKAWDESRPKVLACDIESEAPDVRRADRALRVNSIYGKYAQVEEAEKRKDEIRRFLLAQVPSVMRAIIPGEEDQACEVLPHVTALLREIAGTKGLVPLGFPTTALAPGSFAHMEMRPQFPIRGRLLVLSAGDDVSLEGLLLNGIRVGSNAIEGTSYPIPAAVFGPRAFPLPIAFGAIDVYQTVRLHLENTTARQMTVNGVLLGEPVR